MSDPVPAPDLAGRLSILRRRIADAAVRAGREPASVTLVAVSKGFGAEAVTDALAAGQVDFGENRTAELVDKARAVGSGVRWHFVGRLQRNKVSDVVGLASLVHSVDRIELAQALAKQARHQDRVQRILVQVNADRDPAKAGCDPDDTPDFVAAVRDLPGVACEGLMAIPAHGGDPRPAFARLRRLRDDLRTRFPEIGHLSMGMSSDFEVAVEEGATIVRLGEAVFGPRPAVAQPADSPDPQTTTTPLSA